MKYSFYLLLLSLLLINGCSQDSGIGQFNDLIVDNPDNPYKFSQLTFLVSVHNPNLGYLNVKQIDSLEMWVNAKYWGTFASQPNDTTGLTDTIAAGLPWSETPVKYMFVAPYQLETGNIQTAGDVVDYLSRRIVLTPGQYLSELSKISYHDLQGISISRQIQEFADFEVKERTTSSYMGHIEIQVNN